MTATPLPTPNAPEPAPPAAAEAPACVVSVVVPCKGVGTLGPCLDSLAPSHQDLGLPYEVIVVDGWHDDAVAELCGSFDWVRCVRSRGNLVPGPARNLGVEHARTGLIVFLDADCVAEPDYLRTAYEALNSGARITGGPILDALSNPVSMADNYVQFADFPPGRPDSEQPWLPTCNFAVHKEDFQAVGGFVNTGMPLGEDPILCFEVGRRTPGGVRFTANQRVRHRGRADLTTMMRHHWTFGYGRALLGIEVKPWQRRVGRWLLAVPAIAAWRYLYLLKRTIRWAPARVPRALLLTPFTMPALLAWGWGFRAGCFEPIKDVGSEALTAG
ncbi:MAG: glycosyltransferase [Planctomycetota bacterium]